MKKIVTAIALLASMNSFAFYVGGAGSVSANGLTAKVSVCNNGYSNASMICDIEAKGLVYSGHVLYSFARGVIVPPGQCRYAYVYTNGMNPFVGANGGAQCMWY